MAAVITVHAVQERARRIVSQFRLMHMDEPLPQAEQTSDDKLWVPNHLTHPQFTVAADAQDPRFVFDTQLMPRLLQPSQTIPHHIAVISQITVSRKGGFSCPLRTGAILACVHMNPPCSSGVLGDDASASGPPDAVPAQPKSCQVSASLDSVLEQPTDDPSIASHSTICAKSKKGGHVSSQMTTEDPEDQAVECSHVRHSLKRLTSPFALQLQQCRSVDDLQDMVAQKRLPPVSQIRVHRGQSHFCGVTAEFEVPREDCVQVCCKS